ncbi:autotransporter outer membrane beta-barrel domain-containing protein, partial [Sandarakinorhabdus rubra]|uniref:autotransporter outer membrane beta-barrel domain-containing protein n=1 Tax=Sandarakinorhabdus rubra TaxID=2672568 RepID=UPI0013DD3E60
GGEAIAITLGGAVRGGSGTGVGVQLAGGADNIVTSNGSLSSVSRLAMVGTAGNDTLINNGGLYGNVLLGGGTNLLRNSLGATYVMGETVQLRDGAGSSGTLRNEGVLQIGLSAPQVPVDVAGGQAQPNQDAAAPARSNLLFGARVITQTALAGDFVQTATGRLIADVGFGSAPSDRINVAGNATVAGRLDVTLTQLANAVPYTLIATTGGTGTNNGMTVTDTLAMDYSLAGGAGGITLSYVPRFDQASLWPNGQALGRHMNSALLAGGSDGIGRLMALLGNVPAGEAARFTQLMLQVTPEAWLTPLKLHYQAADGFRRQLFGRNALDIEENSIWANAEYDSFGQKSRADQFGASADSLSLTGGGTVRLGSAWTVSAAAGYRRISRFIMRDGPMADGNGDALQLGAALTFEPASDLKLTAGVAGGWQWLRARRSSTLFEATSAYVEPQARFVQVAASASYDWRWKNGFLRPSLDVAGTALTQSGYEERGLGGAGAQALDETQWLWSLNPQLTAGFSLSSGAKTSIDLQLRGGGVFQIGDSAITMPFRLLGANPAADPAQLTLGLNRAAAQAGADIVIKVKERLSIAGGVSTVRGKRDNLTSARIQARLAF